MQKNSESSGILSSEIDGYFANQERVSKIKPIIITPETCPELKALQKSIAESTIETIMDKNGVLGGKNDENNPETVNEEATPQEIADACRDILDSEICDEIASQENIDDALSLVFTALEETGEDPEEFLKSKNILI